MLRPLFLGHYKFADERLSELYLVQLLARVQRNVLTIVLLGFLQ